MVLKLVLLWKLLGLCAVARKSETCTGNNQPEQREVFEDVESPGANSLLQHASRQIQHRSTGVLNDTQFPDPFQIFGGGSDSISGSTSASSLANVFLGKNPDNMEECGTFLQQVLTQAFSDPTRAIAIIADLISSSHGSTQSLACLKMALDYADQGLVPSECRQGAVHMEKTPTSQPCK